VLVISACSGGPNSDANPIVTPLNGPKQGFITIEERANKRVVDAWFSQGELPEESAAFLWNSGGNRCVELHANSFSNDNRNLKMGTRWRDTLFAGDSIRIESRDSGSVQLLAQRYGSAVLYASDERWIPAPLPEDAQIIVSGSDEFPAFDAISISPLARLVRTAPTDGVTRDLSAAISWEASEATDDSIELTVAASNNSVQTARAVRCWLNDSGQFVLPEVVRQVLPQNKQSVVSLIRTRNASYESDGAQLHISQTSYP